jgi:hypothetical protein
MAAAAISFLPVRKVKRFTKTHRGRLTKLGGMTSVTGQNPKHTSFRRKSANSGSFVPDFGGRSAGNYYLRAPAKALS